MDARPQLLAIAVVLTMLLGMLPPSIQASEIQLTPLRVELSSQQPTNQVTVRNRGDQDRVIQAQVVAWSQEDGEDVHADTDDILVSPPIFTVAAGSTQVVRIGLANRADSTQYGEERSYRLYLQDVPAPPENGSTRLQVVLRLGVPIFVAPTGEARTELAWTARAAAGGGVRIQAENLGNVHAHIRELRVAGQRSTVEAQQVDTRSTHSYLLPGGSQYWWIGRDLQWDGIDVIQLSAMSTQGAINVSLPLESTE